MSTPFDAFGDELKRRMENPFWGSFIISWLLINWKVILIIFSWNSSRIDDKIEYIEKLFPFNTISGTFLSIGHLFLFPLIASFIAIWFIPILAREYLRKQIKNKEKDDNLKIREIESETKVTKEKKVLLEEKKSVKKLEKSQEEIWSEEYALFNDGYWKILEQISILIYRFDGNLFDYQRGYDDKEEILKMADLNGLLSKRSSPVQLSEKGKFLLKLYSQKKKN